MDQQNLSNLQESTLNQFRDRVKQEGLLEKHSHLDNDAFLLRWLRAREFKLDEAEEMLRNHMQWRADNDIDNILEWEPPEDMVKAFPYEMTGVDKQGRPIICYGIWDVRPFMDAGREKEYIKFVFYVMEKTLAALTAPAYQFVAVCDASKVTFSHMTHRKAMDVGVETMRAFEANYPEMMHKCTVVNCPKIYYYIFALIKPLMSAHTLAKIELHDGNREKWIKALSVEIEEEHIPKLLLNVS